MKPIIIAEDNEQTRKIFVSIIERSSKTKVDAVDNGEDLVSKVREGDYSIIFTDNQMPIMYGLTAIKEIRKFNSDIPIYMISGAELEKEAKEAGATDYIDKGDMNLSDLSTVVEKYKKI